MAKRVIGATQSRHRKKFGIDKNVLGVHCDDGTVYVFEKPVNSPRWVARERIDAREGTRTPSPSRLPAAVEAHMDGVTRETDYGSSGDRYDWYWVK